MLTEEAWHKGVREVTEGVCEVWWVVDWLEGVGQGKYCTRGDRIPGKYSTLYIHVQVHAWRGHK